MKLNRPFATALNSAMKEGSRFGNVAFSAFSTEDLAGILAWTKWLETARTEQLEPEDLNEPDIDSWLICAGRGFGKTVSGSNWTWEKAWRNPGWRLAVIAPTQGDCRDICFEGETGLLRTTPEVLIKNYNRSLQEIEFINGSKIKGFGTEDPDRLRGPQHHAVWGDEVGAWKHPRDTFDMMRFGLRLGDKPVALFTTTPRPTTLMVELLKARNVVTTRGTTYDNRRNLPKAFFDSLVKYEGTVLGRQELMGELIDPEESGIFKRSWFKLWPAGEPLPRFELIVQSYDTAFTEKTQNNPTACSVWGIFMPPDKPAQAILLDAWKDRLEYPELRTRIQADFHEARYGHKSGQKAELVIIEDKGSGIAIRQDLERARVPVFPYNPGRADKVQRAHSVSYIPKNALVWVMESTKNRGQPRDWVVPFFEEVCTFPFGEEDDWTDTMSQALAYLRDGQWLRVAADRARDPIEPELDEHETQITNPYF